MIEQGTLLNYIGGRWDASTGTEQLPVHNPATGESLAGVPLSTAHDVDTGLPLVYWAHKAVAPFGPFLNRSTCCFQFSCVNGHANLMRVTFFNCGARDRPERINRMILVDDVPDFNQVRFLRGQFTHELARLIGSIDLHNRRIAKVKFFARDTGD